MKKIVLLTFAVLMTIADCYSFDVKLLASNKESYSRELTKLDLSNANIWSSRHPLKGDLKSKAINVLSSTFNEMERIDTNCELGLVERLNSDAKHEGVIADDSEMAAFVAYLRQQNLIDDILFRLLMDSADVKKDLANLESRGIYRPRNAWTRQNSTTDLKSFYAPFKTWPDDQTTCTLDTYYTISQNIESKNSTDRDIQISKLNYIAFNQGVIDEVTYKKLEILREHNVLGWSIYMKRYVDIINNAKDKLAKNPETTTTSSFSVEYVSRKEKITKRGVLYITYNSTQVMLLSQLLEKTAKRMEAKSSSIHWQYGDDAKDDSEVYILSPLEQYRLAIKMLKHDMAEIMRSDAFKNTGFTYEHIIAAAYETGFVKSAELDHVLKFEDFWNPKVDRRKSYENFAFQVAGSASVFLPPPFNIIAAMGLVISQSVIISKQDSKPDPDDNWNVVI